MKSLGHFASASVFAPAPAPASVLALALAFAMLTVGALSTPAVWAACGDGVDPSIIPQMKINSQDPLVPRLAEFDVSVTADKFLSDFHSIPLSKILIGTKKIPGVKDFRVLTPGPFGAVGSRRIVCQTDGNTAVEEVIEVVPGHSFKYKVWNYSTPEAKPIEYGIGEFVVEDVNPNNHAHVRWIYQFKLRPDHFPGNWGALGRYIFKKTFMNTTYNEFMTAAAQSLQDIFGDGHAHKN